MMEHGSIFKIRIGSKNHSAPEKRLGDVIKSEIKEVRHENIQNRVKRCHTVE